MKSHLKLSILAVAPLLVAGLAACSSSSSDDGGSGNGSAKEAKSLSVTVGNQPGTPTGDTYRAVFKEFTAKTGIKIRVKYAGSDAAAATTALRSAYAAGKESDLLLINPVGAQLTYPKDGITKYVNKYFTDWGIKKKVLPEAIGEYTFDGHLYGMPYEGYQWPMWYNMALLKKAGITQIPTTTDKLLKDAKALRDAGIQPLAVGGSDWTGEKLLVQFAQDYLTSKQYISLSKKGGWCASPEGMKGIKLFVKMRNGGVFVDNAQGYKSDSMTAQFMSGKAAMMSAGSWTLAEVTDAPKSVTSNIKFAGLAIPAGSTFDKPTAYSGTSNGWWITRNGAKKINAVKTFIQFMYKPSTIAEFNNKANMIMSVKTNGSNTDSSSGNPLVAAISAIPSKVDYATNPDAYIPGNLSNSWIAATASAYNPSKSAEDICKAFDAVYSK